MSFVYFKENGFSLVETLVAISILLVIIVGPLTLVSTSARSTSFASEQVVAFFLAQEGAELAQKARDDLMLQRFRSSGALADPWAEFTKVNGTDRYQSCFAANGCGLTITGDAVVVNACTSQAGAGCRLYLNPNQNTAVRSRYSYANPTGAIATPFTRDIRFQRTGDEVRVISRVRWSSGSVRATQEVEVVTYLFNIYGNP